VIRDGAGIWHDPIVSIRTGDPFADTIYNMERASRDYSLPQKYVAGSTDQAVEDWAPRSSRPTQPQPLPKGH
jgi:hypothetical protein